MLKNTQSQRGDQTLPATRPGVRRGFQRQMKVVRREKKEEANEEGNGFYIDLRKMPLTQIGNS
jgi:hypothetical protein